MLAPIISIIIPHYNHAKELQETLKSVFEQTIQDRLEVIVVDDGSEKSQILIRQLADKSKIVPCYPQVRFIFSEHKGAPAARNRGFRESSGDYVIFWDADIVAKPEMLEKMLGELEGHPEASYIYSSFKFGWKTFRCGPFDAARLKKFNYITTTSLIRREHFPGFDEALKKFQDWDLWLTMLGQGRTGRWIDHVLFQVKPRRGGISSWLPSFIYKFPWLPIPTLKRYQYWREIVLRKHELIKD